MSVEAAYAAGLFDGEGCVLVYFVSGPRNTERFVTELQVSNCDRRVLDFLKTSWGGSVRRAQIVREGQRYQSGIWQISGANAEKFANDILPFSLLKREQLSLFIEARSLMLPRGRKDLLTNGNKARRKEIVFEVKKLKRPQWRDAA